MPTITINTNVDRSIANKSFQEKLTNLTAEFYNFPIMYITVAVHNNKKLIFGGVDDPAAFMEIKSISGFGEAENKAASKVICELFKTELGIEPTRLYIYFNTVQLQDVGVEGGTLAN